MKISRKLLIYYVVAGVLLSPSLSFSDVKIILKNGMTMTAEICTDEADRLICSKLGGTFELMKKEVESVREIKSDSQDRVEIQDSVPSKTGQAEVRDGNGGQAEDSRAVDATATLRTRFDQITGRKKELIKERDALQKDRQKVREDVKNAPDWMPEARFDELTKKNAEIDERINRFNEEVKKLNREEGQILDQLKGGSKGP